MTCFSRWCQKDLWWRVPFDVPTGQDVLLSGFLSVVIAGLICASQILHRNLWTDFQRLRDSLRKGERGNKGEWAKKGKWGRTLSLSLIVRMVAVDVKQHLKDHSFLSMHWLHQTTMLQSAPVCTVNASVILRPNNSYIMSDISIFAQCIWPCELAVLESVLSRVHTLHCFHRFGLHCAQNAVLCIWSVSSKWKELTYFRCTGGSQTWHELLKTDLSLKLERHSEEKRTRILIK